jgi:hypothetical protein
LNEIVRLAGRAEANSPNLAGSSGTQHAEPVAKATADGTVPAQK